MHPDIFHRPAYYFYINGVRHLSTEYFFDKAFQRSRKLERPRPLKPLNLLWYRSAVESDRPTLFDRVAVGEVRLFTGRRSTGLIRGILVVLLGVVGGFLVGYL